MQRARQSRENALYSRNSGNLLMRFLEPDEGSLECGGVPLSQLDGGGWRSQIAWVPQRPTIFTGTVAENIALYDPRAGAREIARAADRVGASEFIAALPAGMQTPLGEGARRLSAGQAQRLALARVALADRPLVILDEPTAHLDRARAGSVAEALAELCRGRTSLLVTHDRDLAALADERMELSEGRVHTCGVRTGAPVGAGAPVGVGAGGLSGVGAGAPVGWRAGVPVAVGAWGLLNVGAGEPVA